ncbi:hypothetical protein MTBPR1_140051 [Candidatus Terasakiella magnetica]|uniref:Uncharacterized protein n=1 Tax=Candidatus Terasakiella magnetica TaxID=1867952 RepID=A0A1C3RF64_9PROT|nr:hypothetical protein [Candidatus Terasakiella magnetica]SCA55933.1 hypothetical protein MTBPR1_140051 [Candidatus Terasakiella magnetica]
MNVVELNQWYAQPIHCPFCGKASHSRDFPGCKHLLYVIFDGNFQYRSNYFNQVIGLSGDEDDFDAELNTDEIQKFGEPEDIGAKHSSSFSNLTEFQVDNVSDTAHFGFSSFETELCGWGLEHVSPYMDDSDEKVN